MKFVWENRLKETILLSEKAETGLSYLSPCGSERARKQQGSYYTPADVSYFFWETYFSLLGISSQNQLKTFLRKHHFIEPSVGAGTLVFSLLLKFIKSGLNRRDISTVTLTLVDTNRLALDFVKQQLAILEKRWGITFTNVSFICSDFRRLVLAENKKKIPFYFGNPPFVKNPTNISCWKNIFADFLHIALQHAGKSGRISFILPLSFSFSRDFSELRRELTDSGKQIVLSNYDNIPDTLFKSGKPENTNSNKANSQRCTILHVFPSSRQKILSTRLHRWSKLERHALLSHPPKYLDVTRYSFNDQYPRPANSQIIRYLNSTRNVSRLGDYIQPDGSCHLYVASVARNYVSFRERMGANVHNLRFKSTKQFYFALLILSSDLFFSYWLTVGDGFHLTRSNIYNFPISKRVSSLAESKLNEAKVLWSMRFRFKKEKLNAGQKTVSYDFSKKAPRIYRLPDDTPQRGINLP